MIELDVLIDIGIDVFLLLLHVLHLHDWIMILKGKRRANGKNIVLLSALGAIELLHILADEVLYEMHLIDNPFVGIRLALKFAALLFYGIFILTESLIYKKEKREGKRAEIEE